MSFASVEIKDKNVWMILLHFSTIGNWALNLIFYKAENVWIHPIMFSDHAKNLPTLKGKKIEYIWQILNSDIVISKFLVSSQVIKGLKEPYLVSNTRRYDSNLLRSKMHSLFR